jgi:hypothetical protein
MKRISGAALRSITDESRELSIATSDKKGQKTDTIKKTGNNSILEHPVKYTGKTAAGLPFPPCTRPGLPGTRTTSLPA